MTFELSLLLKTTVLLGAGLVVSRFARRTRASRRHLILASTFAALAGLPLALTFGPAIDVRLPIADKTGMMGAVEPPAVAPPAAAVATTPVPPGRSDVAQAKTRSSWPSAATIGRGLWALGAAGLLTAFAVSLARLRGLRRSGVPWIAGQTIAGAMATQAGIRRPVTVMLTERVAVPATIGLVWPSILLPPDAPQWTDADLRRAFVHELEHVRRGDCWTHLAVRAVCCVYWFHPLVWIVRRQLGIEAERACDDAVVGGMDRTDYADQLVGLAARMSALHPGTMLSMANGSDLSVRVRAILNPRQRRGRPGFVAAVSIMATVAVSVGTVASLRVVAAPRDVSPAPNQDSGFRAVEESTIEKAVRPRDIAEPAAAARVAATPGNAAEPSAPQALRTQPSVPATSGQAAPKLEIAVIIRTTPEEYVIGADDVLQVTVFRQPELSAEVVVRHDGRISLPLVNDIEAAGSTLEQLRARLAERFARFIESPQITVAAKAINSRRVFLTGEVARPGAFALTGPITVLQLIATAGGLTEFAKRDSIFILRSVDGKGVRIPFDYAAFLAGSGPDQNIVLRPGDTVMVP